MHDLESREDEQALVGDMHGNKALIHQKLVQFPFASFVQPVLAGQPALDSDYLSAGNSLIPGSQIGAIF